MFQIGSSQMVCFLTVLRSKQSAVARVIAPVDYERITGRKTRISLCGDESARCSASNLRARPSASSPFTELYNLFNVQRHLISRSTLLTFRATAIEGWIAASAAAA